MVVHSTVFLIFGRRKGAQAGSKRQKGNSDESEG